MSDLEHQERLKRTELTIQRAKLIGVIATSMAAVATAAVVLVPLLTHQQSQASQPQQVKPSEKPAIERGPTNEAVCSHVIALMRKELGNAAAEPSAEELQKFLMECAAEMEKERSKLGETKFDMIARCLMAASKMEEMAKCEPD